MKIAVIGAGVSGLVAARLLATQHDVLLFEACDYAGGHANTVDVLIDGESFSVDTGFMVFNERTYHRFTRLLELLGIESQPTDMSFSVSCEQTGLEYQGSSLSGIFAQRKNLLRPRFWRMLGDIVKVNRLAAKYSQDSLGNKSLGDFLRDGRYGHEFREHYLLPMTAAIWSCPTIQVLDFPARFLFEFMRNHGLLQLRDRPRWLTIPGGSRRYVTALTRGLGRRVRLSSPVASVSRQQEDIVVTTSDNVARVFDSVVFATHADITLRILDDPDTTERRLLGAFLFQRNEAILHTDESWLPQRRSAWASWNYRIRKGDSSQVCMTYDLSRLQQIDSRRRLLVTLNPPCEISPERVLKRIVYEHPVFSRETAAAQSWLAEINGRKNTYFCGAYWKNGFHEDGVVSALAVTERFGIGLEACIAPCIAASSHITAAAL